MTDQRDNSGPSLSNADDLKARLRDEHLPMTRSEAADGIEQLEHGIEQLGRRIDHWMQEVGKLHSRVARLSDALTQSRAETAAAYERAAALADYFMQTCMDQETNPEVLTGYGRGMYFCAKQYQTEIRALATPDQTSALDAVRAEAREQGMREAAYIAFNACLVLPDGGNPTEEERLVCDEAYNRILAAIKGGKT